jgi:hypothetical protein
VENMILNFDIVDPFVILFFLTIAFIAGVLDMRNHLVRALSKRSRFLPIIRYVDMMLFLAPFVLVTMGSFGLK